MFTKDLSCNNGSCMSICTQFQKALHIYIVVGIGNIFCALTIKCEKLFLSEIGKIKKLGFVIAILSQVSFVDLVHACMCVKMQLQKIAT